MEQYDYEKEKEKLQRKLKQKTEQLQQAISYYELTKKEKTLLEQQISMFDIKNKSYEISDHALVRYMERVLNIDIVSYKEAILDILTKYKLPNGQGRITINGITFVVKNYIIITIMDETN